MHIGIGIGATKPFVNQSPSSFLPTDISGCLTWLRADLGVTLSGSDVTDWADQSGLGHDVTGPAGNRPTYNATDANFNNQASISFVSSSLLRFELAGADLPTDMSGTDLPFSAFIVAKHGTASTNDGIFCMGAAATTDRHVIKYDNAPDTVHVNLHDGTSLHIANETSLTSGTAAHYHSVLSSGTAIDFYQDGSAGDLGVTANPAGSVDLDGGAIGATYISGSYANHLEGEIAEIIFYDSKLSAGDRASVESYLSERYGI